MTEMSGYRRVNYYELCRLCTSSEGNKMNIFRDEGRRRQLQSKIHMYLHVQVMEEDSLPKIVCHECVRKLENFAEFRQSVVSAEGMLESYFTSMNFNEECLKEGKVYVKSTEKEKAPTPEDSVQEEDPLKIIEKVPSTPSSQFIASPESQTSHQQPVLVSNINAANIQIISGQYKQYKCAMQMQSGGGVAAAVVEATAETHYSYQQQTSHQVSSQQQNLSQNQITEQSPPQPTQIHQVQNQIQSQNQISQQVQSFRQISQQSTNQSNQINQHVNQHQGPITQQIQHLQRQQRDMQQRHLQQIEKQHVHVSEQQEQQQLQQSQNNNIVLKAEEQTEQTQQVIQKVQSEALKNEGNQTFTAVQASPEVFLSLGFKDSTLSAQATREDVKDFKEYTKSVVEDGRGTMISEFLRLRPVNESSSLITVNPQVIVQSTRDVICRDCGKCFTSLDMLDSHSCNPSLTNEGSDTMSKEDSSHVNVNGSAFSCDVCGKPFKRKEHLFQHRKLHSGERPYVCTTCTKAFSRKEHLVRHLVSHTGQKMHECEMCGKSFSRKDNLHKHRKTHGVAGPYICETCGKSFVVKHYYLMHLTTHAATAIIDDMDPLPYKCDMCHKAFSVKEYLASHKMRHRSKNTSNSQNSINGQQTQEQMQQHSSGNHEVNVTGNEVNSGNMTSANSQSGNGSVIQLQSVIERNEQQNGSFGSNQYPSNISEFQ